jgi:uncharacterized protein (TIGR00251 family)
LTVILSEVGAPSPADWLREVADWRRATLTLSIHVQPAAKRSEIVGLHGDALKVRLAAPAIDGRANAALLEFLRSGWGWPSRWSS